MEHFDVPDHILRYALKTQKIAPAARVGTARLWRRADLKKIEAALEATAKRSTIRERRRAAMTTK